MNFDWMTSLNQAAFFSGLVVLAGLLWPGSRRISGKRYLILLMLTICLALLANTLRQAWFESMAQLFLAADVFIFLLGPLVYLSMTGTASKKAIAHFLPAFIYLLLVTILSLQAGSGLLIILSAPGLVTNTALPLIYFLATIQTIIYMSLGMLYIKKQAESWRGLPSILVGSLLFINVFCLSHFLPYLGLSNPLSMISTDVIWLVIVLLVFILNVHFVVQGHAVKEGMEKGNKAAQLPRNATDIQGRLEQLMRHNRLYHDPELTLSMVSDKLDTTKATLSLVLNAHMNTSFYEYINALRVEGFVSAVNNQDFPNLTHFGIAQKVGFKSKTTFYKSFKTIYHTTPRAYFTGGPSIGSTQA